MSVPARRGRSATTTDRSQERLARGWTIQSTRLTQAFGRDPLKQRLGNPHEDWPLPGGATTADGD